MSFGIAGAEGKKGREKQGEGWAGESKLGRERQRERHDRTPYSYIRCAVQTHEILLSYIIVHVTVCTHRYIVCV